MSPYHVTKIRLSLLTLFLLLLMFSLYGCGRAHTRTASPAVLSIASHEPDLANTILHWTEGVTFRSDGDTQQQTLEMWEKIGPDKHVQIYQRAVLESGKLLYSLAVPGHTVSVTTRAPGKYSCQLTATTRKDDLFTTLKAFPSLAGDEQSFVSARFQRRSGRIIAPFVPTTPSVQGINPLLTVARYRTNVPIHEWVLRQAPGTGLNFTSHPALDVIDVDMQGQVVAKYNALLRTTSGEMIQGE